MAITVNGPSGVTINFPDGTDPDTINRVMHEALNSYTQFLRQPHVAESGAVAWTNHPHVPQPIPLPNIVGLPPFVDGSPRSIAPGKGEHSAAILREHGFEAGEIERLVADGIVGI